jgi:phosphoacetylglucosamine mutase
MLEASWEKYATQLANAKDDDDLVRVYAEISKSLKVNVEAPANVVFARDTRASGPRLVECLVDALNATDAKYTDFKFATTPQLHYYVRCINTKGTQDEYGEATEKGYYEKMGAAFKQALGQAKPVGSITVDCANGVGAPKLKDLISYLPSAADGGLDIKMVNEDIHKPDSLNYNVSSPFRCASSQFANPSTVRCRLRQD